MTNIKQLCDEYNVRYYPDTTKLFNEDEVLTSYVVNLKDDACSTVFNLTEEQIIELIKTDTVYDVRQVKSYPILPDPDYISQITDDLFIVMRDDLKESDPDLYVQIQDYTSVKQITDQDILDQLIYLLVEYY